MLQYGRKGKEWKALILKDDKQAYGHHTDFTMYNHITSWPSFASLTSTWVSYLAWPHITISSICLSFKNALLWTFCSSIQSFFNWRNQNLQWCSRFTNIWVLSKRRKLFGFSCQSPSVSRHFVGLPSPWLSQMGLCLKSSCHASVVGLTQTIDKNTWSDLRCLIFVSCFLYNDSSFRCSQGSGLPESFHCTFTVS